MSASQAIRTKCGSGKQEWSVAAIASEFEVKPVIGIAALNGGQQTRYKFVRFEDVGLGRGIVVDAITIRKDGTIGLPKRFSERNGTAGFQYATLFVDPSRRAIGVRFDQSRQDNSLKILGDRRPRRALHHRVDAGGKI
jgi:hypothetical protein